MGELILILGGARSGKSAQAVRIARQIQDGQVLFVATAEPGDNEMHLRIEKHRAERPAHWHTLEAPRNVGKAIGRQSKRYSTIIVDCITLLVSNLLVDMPDPYAEAGPRTRGSGNRGNSDGGERYAVYEPDDRRF